MQQCGLPVALALASMMPALSLTALSAPFHALLATVVRASAAVTLVMVMVAMVAVVLVAHSRTLL
jgi:hypothetical protein